MQRKISVFGFEDMTSDEDSTWNPFLLHNFNKSGVHFIRNLL